MYSDSFAFGLYDSFYGEEGRNSQNPPYDMTKVLLSKTNVAIRKSNIFKPRLRFEDGYRIRSKLDYSKLCDMAKRNTSMDFKCNGYCLFDLYKDPCETTNIVNEQSVLVNQLKGRIEEYYKQLMLQDYYIPDPDSVPSKCNGTWFMWKDDPPYCPLNLPETTKVA